MVIELLVGNKHDLANTYAVVSNEVMTKIEHKGIIIDKQQHKIETNKLMNWLMRIDFTSVSG